MLSKAYVQKFKHSIFLEPDFALWPRHTTQKGLTPGLDWATLRETGFRTSGALDVEVAF